MNPRASKLATPNTVLATPGRGSNFGGLTPSVSGTPTASVAGSQYTASHTPLRDEFGLNDPSDAYSMSDSMSVSSRMDKSRDKAFRAKISSQLRGLPEPEYTYEISIPELEDDSESSTSKVEDASEVALRQEALRREEEEAELARRSAVLRRNLPRPISVNKELSKSVYPVGHELTSASGMIGQEMIRILAFDSYR